MTNRVAEQTNQPIPHAEALGDGHTPIAKIKQILLDFAIERDWEQFHTPKDLAIALAIETGEVLDHLRFKTNEQIATYLADAVNHREFAYELADCFWAIVRLADVTGIDLSQAMANKLVLAAEKYPANQVRGNPAKYTEYHRPPGNESVGSENTSPR